MRKRMMLSSVVAIAALALTGCAGGESEPVEDDSAAESTEPTTPAAEESEDIEAADGDVTAPGTELGLGEAATVLWPETDQHLSVTVTAVEEADLAEVEAAAGADFMAQIEGYTLYYIKVDATKLEPFTAELSGDKVVDEMYAFDADGNRLTPVTLAGTFEPCDGVYFDEEHDAGQTANDCFIAATAEGQEFGYAAWTPTDTEYDYNGGEPVMWRP